MATLFVGGCASTPPKPVELPRPITMAEVKEMSAKGVADETIIGALRATRAAYYLKSEHVIDLQQAGVSREVIDYLLSTPQLFPPLPQISESHQLPLLFIPKSECQAF